MDDFLSKDHGTRQENKEESLVKENPAELIAGFLFNILPTDINFVVKLTI